MKITLGLLCILAFATFQSASAAEANKWEVSGGSSVSLGVFHIGADSGIDSRTNGQFGVSGLAGYLCSCGFESTVSTSFSYLTGDSGYTFFTLLAGPTYNFSSDTLNSIYVSARAGIALTRLSSPTIIDGVTESKSTTYVPFAWSVSVGKRFAIFDHVSWKPEFEWSGHTSSQLNEGTSSASGLLSTMAWTIVPLQAAVIF